MPTLARVVLFKGLYAAAVLGAARGEPWWGPLALAPFLAVHLMLTPAALRARELGFVAAGGLAGVLLDSGVRAAGWTDYAAVPAGWPPFLVPPWIAALWFGFVALIGSLETFRARPLAALLLGAVGGPLSFWCGSRLGATRIELPWLVLGLLALEYGALVPALARLAPRAKP